VSGTGQPVASVVFAGPSGAPARRGQNKNFFRLRGQPVVQRALDLLEALELPRIILLTTPERTWELRLPAGTVIVPSSRRQSENVRRAREAIGPVGPEDHALVLFGDTPLLSRACVEDFLARCSRIEADFVHGLVPQPFVDPFLRFSAHRGVGRRPFATREFWSRVGALFLVRVQRLDPGFAARATDAYMSERKQDTGGGYLAHALVRGRMILTMSRYLGFRGTALGLRAALAHSLRVHGFHRPAEAVRRHVTLAAYEAGMTRMLGLRARLIPCPFGTASLDVDDEGDLAVFEGNWEEMSRLAATGERLLPVLADPARDPLAQADPEVAEEMRRSPEIYSEQRRILLEFPVR